MGVTEVTEEEVVGASVEATRLQAARGGKL
jgi:hypothetical protein